MRESAVGAATSPAAAPGPTWARGSSAVRSSMTIGRASNALRSAKGGEDHRVGVAT